MYIQLAIDIYTTLGDLRVPYMGDEAMEEFDVWPIMTYTNAVFV